MLINLVLVLKICNQATSFVLNSLCFKVSVNEIYAFFLYFNDSHIDVDIISTLSDT